MPSTAGDESPGLAALVEQPDFGARMLNILSRLGDAEDTECAVAQFRLALDLIGADAGLFHSVIRDEATRRSHRSLLAGDPVWASEYARGNWHEHDPWLRHALHNAEPVRGSELDVRPDEADFISVSSRLGFASSLIVPAPSPAGMSRVAVLALGSHRLGFFEHDGYPALRVLARALAMELNRWLLRAIRQELLARSGITPDEITLLRHEEAGHTSKMIGATMHIEAKTIDCRFQRLNAKLDAPDRRTAARIARLYGLL